MPCTDGKFGKLPPIYTEDSHKPHSRGGSARNRNNKSPMMGQKEEKRHGSLAKQRIVKKKMTTELDHRGSKSPPAPFKTKA